MKVSEAIDFAQAVRPQRVIAIHDGQLNQRGLASVNRWLSSTIPGYRRLAPGQIA